MKPSTDLDPCWQLLCAGESLQEGGLARSFELLHQGRPCRAFALRHQGRVQAYLNRCSHVALELDWLPDRFFDAAGQYLVCAAHGALFLPDTGACIGGPGRGPLVKIPLLERDGIVYWQSGQDFVPAAT
ncbi:2Fe-2S ferredoxin [Malikia spinosa]|uniref:2Fe-2S ferredoxin n=1 Tax=Malikia spinosa TaxID=86180 RepID=A0A2S9KIA4_9BURK|nr:Rieske 2Fe-2S domain-containing protein [Malikia spinosa]PRD70137.1 2Fe-2S ferredoxin [Malikia spinosa]